MLTYLLLLSALMAPSTQRTASVSSFDQVFPQIVSGPTATDEWATTVTIANLGDSTAPVSLYFYAPEGGPWQIQLEGLPTTDLYNFTLQPKQTITLTTAKVTNFQHGWAFLSVPCCHTVTGYAVFRQRVVGRPDFEAVTPLSSSNSQHSFLAFDNTSAFSTGVAIVNPSNSTNAVITIQARDENGALIFPLQQVTLLRQTKNVYALPVKYPILDGKRGTIEFTSTPGQFGVLGLRFNPGGAFTSIQSWEP